MELPAQISNEENKRNSYVEHNRTSDEGTNLNNIDNWKRIDVYRWLIKNNVPKRFAKILYNNHVYGASLNCFDKQDLLNIGLLAGPAFHISKLVAENFKHRATTIDADASIGTSQHFQQQTEGAESPTTGSAEVEQTAQMSIEENRSGVQSVETWSDSTEDIPRRTGSKRNAPPFQDENVVWMEEQNNSMSAKADEARGGQPFTQCTEQTNNVESETQVIDSENLEDMSKRSVFRYCAPRPFDKSSETFAYTQNDILPTETGPSNLIDPVHEYKLLGNTKDASEENVLKKFKNETFRFAAGCINSRSNGTIHFGVGDEPLHKHGKIIGLEVLCHDKYVEAFDNGLKEHFKDKSNIAMTCIRPPKFVKVKCPDNKAKCVIEVDVVPKYKLTQKKRFYTTVEKKENKTKCLFIRSGASTINYLPKNYPKIHNKKLNKLNKKLSEDVELWALARQLAEEDIASLRTCSH